MIDKQLIEKISESTIGIVNHSEEYCAFEMRYDEIEQALEIKHSPTQQNTKVLFSSLTHKIAFQPII